MIFPSFINGVLTLIHDDDIVGLVPYGSYGMTFDAEVLPDFGPLTVNVLVATYHVISLPFGTSDALVGFSMKILVLSFSISTQCQCDSFHHNCNIIAPSLFSPRSPLFDHCILLDALFHYAFNGLEQWLSCISL